MADSTLIYTQKTNPITGKSQWEIQSEDYDYHQEIARSAFADMLHDTERNQKYEKALKIAIDKMHELGRKANVLDIGTGTGLLSLMAIRHGADSVVACEAFKPMADCAAKVIQEHNVDNKLTLISKRSTELTVGIDGDLKEKANILVAEVFDTELIGEGAIATFTHAHKYLMEEDSIVVPDSAIVYAQVIESPTLQSWNKLNDLVDSNGVVILKTPEKMLNCCGSAAVHDLQLNQLPPNTYKQLSEPQPVLYFNWNSCIDESKMTSQNVVITQSGTAQMVFMWWELIMDTEGLLTLSCAPWWHHPDVDSQTDPNSIPWRDHWLQGIYYLPNEIPVTRDSEANLITCHDEYSLWFHLENEVMQYPYYKRPMCECGVHMAFSRTHIAYLNDRKRSKIFLARLGASMDFNSVVLDLNDSSFQGLASAKFGVKKVYIVKDINLNVSILKDFIEENNIHNVDLVPVATEEMLKTVTHVIFDPCLSCAILPWDNLKSRHLLQQYKEMLPKSVKIIPEKCSYYAMPVEFFDLHKIRMPLGMCEGIDHSSFDKIVEASRQISDDDFEAQPLWEYPCYCRGKPQEMLSIEFDQLQSIYSDENSFTIRDTNDGDWKVNGFAVWSTWAVGDEVINMGPTQEPVLGDKVEWDIHSRQAVKLLKTVVNVSKDDKWRYKVQCDINRGEFILSIDLETAKPNNQMDVD